MGQLHGNIVLKKNKEKFEKEIASIKKDIDVFLEKAGEIITAELNKTKDAIIKRQLPSLKKNPPEDLRQSFLFDSANKDHIKEYIENKIKSAFPTPDQFMSKMRIRHTYKDVTYETLKDPIFQGKIKEYFPNEGWAEPLSEISALGEREEQELRINNLD